MPATTKTLDVHTAELTTAAVEVKTLTIRGKQVTLAVFRQLQEQPLILTDGTLAGVPWGRVNYHPDKCGDDAEHMHVVWQEGSELRRARVDTRPSFGLFQAETADLYVSLRWARLRFGEQHSPFWAETLGEWSHKRWSRYDSATSFFLQEAPDVRIEVNVHADAAALPDLPGKDSYERSVQYLARWLALDADEHDAKRQAALDSGQPSWQAGETLAEHIAAARESCERAINDAHEAARAVHEYLATSDPVQELRDALVEEVAAEQARRERIRANTAAIGELPQLFIAV